MIIEIKEEVPSMAKYEIVVGRNHYIVYGYEIAWAAWVNIIKALELVDLEQVAYLMDVDEDEIIAEFGEP